MARFKNEKRDFYCADFENTVPKTDIFENGILDENAYNIYLNSISNFETEVWAWGIGKVKDDPQESDVSIGNSIKSFVTALKKLPSRSTVLFHNLAYDGKLLMDYLIKELNFSETLNGTSFSDFEIENLLADGYTADEIEKMEKKRAFARWPERQEYKTLISDMGVFYSIKLQFCNGVKIEIRDSLKILPFSVDAIAKGFKTKAQKLKGTIDYSLKRYAGWNITKTEEKYLKNDVLVMMEAIEKVKKYHLLESLTIAGACLKCFKTNVWDENMMKLKSKDIEQIFRGQFPVLSPDLDAVFRQGYKGGWCFVNPKFADEIIHGKGEVYDVNSLYPSVMYHHEYPIGEPFHFIGKDFHYYEHNCYIIKCRGTFRLKKDHLPFIQIKNSMRWASNEYITDQDEYDREFVFTKPDFELFLEQYEPDDDFTIIEGWVFKSSLTIFDKYIEHWYNIKLSAKGDNPVLYVLAKLFLNSLYGKFAMAPNPSSGHIVIDNGKVKIKRGILKRTEKGNEIIDESEERDGIYIPIGAFITAYARGVTVRAAQKNYDIFLYSDTDSIHTLGKANEIDVGLDLGQWENENSWDKARFVRQKTYIEHITHKDGEEIKPYISIKACGAPATVKERIQYKVTEIVTIDGKQRPSFYELQKDEDGNIISERRTDDEIIERFTHGLIEAGKLMKKTVDGGVILAETTFQIK